MSVLLLSALFACSDYELNAPVNPNELPPSGVDTLTGGHPTRDTDGDGIPDSEDLDADGDGIPNDLDPDPDGDGVPGWSLGPNPEDDPPIDLSTGLPELEPGGVRGRICAPNQTTWVAGAEITIVTSLGVYTATTNGDGYFQVDSLPSGTHTVIVKKGSFATSFEVVVEAGAISEVLYDECLEQGDLRIAVVTGEYDDIGEVLTHLGLTYDTVNGTNDASTIDFLLDVPRLNGYDMVFFNCGMSFGWLDDEETTEPTEAQAAANLRDFAYDGGSIYASDWAYLVVERPFPEMITFLGDDAEPGAAFVGVATEIDAIVVDPAMASLLGGNSAHINYDLNIWVAMESVAPSAAVLIQGDFPIFDENQNQLPASGPLATKFSHGTGNVTFTTFHNEVQTTLDMEVLLEDIVLSL